MAICNQEIHVGDIGTIFRITIYDGGTTALDVSTATSQEIIFLKPDGTTVTQTSSFYTDGTDGIIQYTTIANDLDAAGTWKLQAKVTLPGGTWSSCTQKFKVYANLA